MTEVLTSPFEDFIILNSGDKIYPEELEEFLYKGRSGQRDVCFYGFRNAWCGEIKSPLGHHSPES